MERVPPSSFSSTPLALLSFGSSPITAGKLMHAEVRLDDTVVMIADSSDGWPPVPSYVHIYV
jgi:uncharacterized glyoxalase superfamily protein PhnB